MADFGTLNGRYTVKDDVILIENSMITSFKNIFSLSKPVFFVFILLLLAPIAMILSGDGTLRTGGEFIIAFLVVFVLLSYILQKADKTRTTSAREVRREQVDRIVCHPGDERSHTKFAIIYKKGGELELRDLRLDTYYSPDITGPMKAKSVFRDAGFEVEEEGS